MQVKEFAQRVTVHRDDRLKPGQTRYVAFRCGKHHSVAEETYPTTHISQALVLAAHCERRLIFVVR